MRVGDSVKCTKTYTFMVYRTTDCILKGDVCRIVGISSIGDYILKLGISGPIGVEIVHVHPNKLNMHFELMNKGRAK